MAFFDSPPPPPEEFDSLPPEWSGPPDNFLGAPLALRVVLARTPDIVIAITDGSVFPTGAAFRLSLRMRSMSDDLPDALREAMMMGGPFHSHRHRFGSRSDPTQIPPEQLRFGLQFSDGRKATSLGGPHWGEESPSGPLLMPTGGGGGLRSWDMSYWLWPLPPRGPLEFVVEWPVANIPLTRTKIDGSLIVDAASEAEELWPQEQERGGSHAFGGGSVQTAIPRGGTGYANQLWVETQRPEPLDEPDATDE